jgi:hypothetical protein
VVADESLPPDLIDPSEDRIILALLAIVGALGIGIGFTAPERTLEPSLGLLMLVFAARTYLVETGAFGSHKERPTTH